MRERIRIAGAAALVSLFVPVAVYIWHGRSAVRRVNSRRSQCFSTGTSLRFCPAARESVDALILAPLDRDLLRHSVD